ncbi:MAG: polysaccharide deacetylase family protein [Candidatus Thermoplasmatota archaeon]|nr:polysaccharide deacetylase family protein [Candidatus Thermoplasmatota archaeon]
MFIITFDLELYDPMKSYSDNVFEKYIKDQETILKNIFSLFYKNKIRISCFVTNEFVKYYYDFFHKYIVSNHEISCHTANHLFFNGTNLEEYVDNIRENKRLLERESGKKCLGFRSPGGQIPNNLISILKKLNIKYDSSVIPGILPGRFNNSKAPKEPYFPNYNNIFVPDSTNTEVIEFPLLTSRTLRISMNGFFFSYYSKFIDLDEYKNNFGVIYLHPSDFKRFKLFEKTFIWDKIKLTKNNWNFLSKYVNTIKKTDLRLINLLNTGKKEEENFIITLD